MSASTKRKVNLHELEKAVLKATMARYREHKKKYLMWDGTGHTAKTNTMYFACEALDLARRAKKSEQANSKETK